MEKQQIKLVVFDWAGTTTDFGSQAPVDVFDRTFRQKGLVFTKDEINAPMELREMGLKIGSTTGYTSEIMEYVLPVAKKQGYEPDCCVTPDVTEYSRPTPFMVFECMRQLNVFPPKLVVKAGDTVMDILEGKNAGAWSVGIIKGSSVVGLSEAEYNALGEAERKELHEKARKIYMEAGADYVIEDITELPEVINKINERL